MAERPLRRRWRLAAAGVGLLGAATLGLLPPGSAAVPCPDEDATVYQRRGPTAAEVLQEDFDGPSLDTDLWARCYWWDLGDGCTNRGNAELEWYLPAQVLLGDGTARLRAEDRAVTTDAGETFAYRSGMITTGPARNDAAPGAAFTYGTVEVRARVPSGSGLWPALWLLPTTQESRPEVDIMEVLGDSTDLLRLHVHYLDEGGARHSLGHDVEVADLSQDFHTYGVRWSRDRLTFTLDGREVWAVTEPRAIPQEPMYLLANLAVGGEWPGPPGPDTTFPTDFVIDRVTITSGCWA